MGGRFLALFLGSTLVLTATTASDTPALFEPVESTRDLLIALGILILAVQTSEDLTCIGAGILVSAGYIGFWWATFGCFIGLLVGDCGLYLLGRIFGNSALKWRFFKKRITQQKVNRWRRGFERNGFSLIFMSRFLPGARVPVYLAAGLLRVPFRKFAFYLAIAAWLWTPLLVGLAAWMGKPFLKWFETNQVYAIIGLIGFVIALWLIIHKGIPLFTWRGRRMALGFWRRVFRWEFWPRLIFYPPVVAYVIWLMIKHRSATLFTAVNPGMPNGSGFLMERKSDIFDGIGNHNDIPELPAWAKIPAGEIDDRVEKFETALTENDLSFPVILKPDIGLRGRDVKRIHTPDDAREYFDEMTADAIVQEIQTDLEFGVFYIRQPDEETGTIFSITEKQPVTVTGDGETRLENLILADDRAVCMAPFFLERHAEKIDDIIPDGEKFELTHVGSHCQGALFLNGADCITPELTAAIDRISKNYNGFYFGRYDIKVPSRGDFIAGKNLRILELNGVTAEATHIYHPHTSIFTGYRTLFRQWRLAFEIAAKNVAAGAKPLGLSETRRLWKEYRKS